MSILVVENSQPVVSAQCHQPWFVSAQTNGKNTVGMKPMNGGFVEVYSRVLNGEFVAKDLIAICYEIEQRCAMVEDVGHFMYAMCVDVDLMLVAFLQPITSNNLKEWISRRGS